MPKILNMSYFNNRKQQILNFRSKLQSKHNGCPWPANIIAIVKLAQSPSPKCQKALELIKKIKRFSDDDIFILISCYENKDWENKSLSSVLFKNNVL